MRGLSSRSIKCTVDMVKVGQAMGQVSQIQGRETNDVLLPALNLFSPILEAKRVSNEKTPTDSTRTGTHFIILVHHGLCSIARIPVSDVEWYYDFRILDVSVPQSECYTVPDPHAGKKAVAQGCSFSHGGRTQRPARNKRDRWRGLPDIRCVDAISYE
ncbi:hypothetical protein EV421DRAFT_600582 [Armillaria borealis]|uniref:Uncharacterized protein n=1 Tax=Armillaria borealis TaxID=47425 RepID=A0AA39MPU5_9AGAR|nr:hypothetical protein EV421DRAFT_600582 [Armillaria borealis]